MALQIAASRFALHKSSKQVLNHIKDGSKTVSSKVYTATRYKTTSDKELEPVIPSVDVFKGLEDSKEKEDRLPSVAECAVHLEFLAVLHELHQRIVESEELDDVFNIKPNKKTVVRMGESVQLKDDTLLTRKQAKWDRYIELAVVRFIVWMKTAAKIYPVQEDGTVKCTAENLPPLDVLMVWHSFLLNPRWYRKFCGDGTKRLYKVEFPWALIHQAVNAGNWIFSLPTSAATNFSKATSLAPDLLASLLGWKSYSVQLRNRLVKYAPTSSLATASENRLLTLQDAALLQQITKQYEEPTDQVKAAVIRQSGFVDKMWDRIWIRSPALEGTVRRGRERYKNFLDLFRLYPNVMFVPTLDIDLVWHTHQCSAERYHQVTQEVAGKFVNHDDSIVQDKLDTGMKETQGLYRIRFGREYLVCGCWDCETLLSAVEKAGAEPNWEVIAKQVSQDVEYYRAVEVARRTKAPLPIR